MCNDFEELYKFEENGTREEIVDRITKSYLNEFSEKYGLECSETEKFEHFCNYVILSPITSHSISVGNLEQLHIGIDGTIAIDGFAILLNKELMTSEEEIEDYFQTNKKVSCEVIFIQSKTSQEFKSTEVYSFGDGVNDFVSETQKLVWTPFAKEKINLFSILLSNVSKLEEKPICYLYYISLGIDNKDQNVYARIDGVTNVIKDQNIFSSVNFKLIDAASIQTMYKKLGQSITRSFEFDNKIVLPETNGVREAYVGLVDGNTVVQLMSSDDGTSILPVFYDNVRDFQGSNTKVNRGIKETIESSYKDAFSILNNGITIVAEQLRTIRNTFTITNYQIINGCQTANVLYQNREVLNNSIQVVLKLIISDDQDLISRVIRSTNSQTEVKTQDLLAYSVFQKTLESYYGTFNGQNRLYYERRSKQYETSSEIDKARIIDKALQIKVVCCFFFDKPNLATRYFGTLFNEFGKQIFKDTDNPIPYYLAAFVYYKIEKLFKLRKIDPKYRKIKFFILTMIRYELGKKEYPKFNSKKISDYCDEILKIVNDDQQFIRIVNGVLSKIDLTGEDLYSPDISKSAEFVSKCLSSYND